MNNNKIYEEVNNENLCVICLEDLNDEIMDVCHKCNVKCHIKCLNDWHKKNNEEICPICLKSEDYYLNILKNNNNSGESGGNSVENINNIEDIEEGNNEDTIDNYVIVYEPNQRMKNCMIICCMMFTIISIVLLNQ
jgi:hypothetical protein